MLSILNCKNTFSNGSFKPLPYSLQVKQNLCTLEHTKVRIFCVSVGAQNLACWNSNVILIEDYKRS